MFKLFSGKTADETWLKVVDELRLNPNASPQPGRGGPTQEILHSAISVENCAARWVISRHPAINPAYAFAELIWTVNGREDSAFLTYFNSKLPELAGDGPTFHGAYGKRLRKHLGFDQLARAYRVLKRNPDGRQVVLQIWDGRIDLPDDEGQPVSPDIPCNLLSLLKVRGGQLEWTQVMRSNDIYRGIPYDFVQFTFLQEIIAGWLGVKPGTYCHLSDSLHVYLKDLEKVLAASPVCSVIDTASLALSFEESESVFLVLSQAADLVTRDDQSVSDLLTSLQTSTLPQTYRDMLAVLTAEGLRIRGAAQAAHEALAVCTNPLYRQLWQRWFSRYPTKRAEPKVLCRDK